MLGTGVQNATLNSLASVGLAEKVTSKERFEGREDVGGREKSQGKDPKIGVRLACLGSRREASVWSRVRNGESCSHCKDFGFILREVVRHGRGQSRQVT